jgi:hypothetical protein
MIAYWHRFVAAFAVVTKVREKIPAIFHTADLLMRQNVADLACGGVHPPADVSRDQTQRS